MWIPLSLLVACGGPPPPTPAPPSAPQAPSATTGAATPFVLQTDDGPVPLPYALAYTDVVRDTGPATQIMLATEPFDCDSARHHPPERRITFTLRDVPETEQPGRIGTHADLRWLGATASSRLIDPSHAWVQIEPFAPSAGTEIHGSAGLTGRGAGDFIARTCPGFSRRHALGAEVPDAPLSGTIAGQEVSLTHAVAVVADRGAGRMVLSLRFPNRTSARCDMGVEDQGSPVLYLEDIGGASAPFDGSGRPQPANARTRPSDATQDPAMAPQAWVQLDALDLSPGATLHGALVAQAPPDANGQRWLDVKGRFDALVCDW